MTGFYSENYLRSLVKELTSLPRESEWVEFKRNNGHAEEIGEYISALANSAAFCGKASAYVLWGVDDETHEIVGTTFNPAETKVGNEELENWLLRLLTPKIEFRFHQLEVDGKQVVILEVERASRQPVSFEGQEFLRVGSYKKKLKDLPEKERQLWRIFDNTPFEDRIASPGKSEGEVLQLLDYPGYFDLLERPLPENRAAIIESLENESLICREDTGTWAITNLGAILFAKHLDAFPSLKRKAMRVIQYRGKSRVETIREQVGGKGYATGFEGLIGFINDMLPRNEVLGQALRKDVRMYPEIAIREVVANALIHQDFSVRGSGPMVELFEDRMEVTNPGTPLVSPERFLDTPPRSRNEGLAALMRRMGVCEERGSGVDKVVLYTEVAQLPAPLFESSQGSTCVVLFAHRSFKEMDKSDRVRACYQHACLKYVNREFLTNASLRERFGLEQSSSATASRLIKEAVEAKQILPVDDTASRKFMKYQPWWASGLPMPGTSN